MGKGVNIMIEIEGDQGKIGNPGVFDFRIMQPAELSVKLSALRACEPSMVSPSSAASTLEALIKSGITGGNDAYFLRKQKDALELIEKLDEPVNFNEVLADVIEQTR